MEEVQWCYNMGFYRRRHSEAGREHGGLELEEERFGGVLVKRGCSHGGAGGGRHQEVKKKEVRDEWRFVGRGAAWIRRKW